MSENIENYWSHKLEGEIAVSSVPADVFASGLPGGRRACVEFEYGKDVIGKLNLFTRNSNYGLYMFLVSAVKYLLCRYTGTEDTVVGMPPFRKDADTTPPDSVLLLRDTVDENGSFRELLMSVRQTVLEADSHPELPFESLAAISGADLKLPKPYIGTVVMLEQVHDGKNLERIFSDMVFDFSAGENSLLLRLEYDEGVYCGSTAERVTANLSKIIGTALQNPNIPLADIDMLTEEEKRHLLFSFNDTRAGYPRDKTIHGIFEEQAARTPDNIAVVFDEQSLSYRELNEKSNRLARELRNYGVGPDDIVGIYLERSIEMITAALAVLKAGGAYLPIDSFYPAERIKYMLEDSGAKILLLQSKSGRADVVRDLLEDSRAAAGKESALRVIDINEHPGADDASNLEPVNTPNDLAYIIYTSGTTGKSKGAMIEHKNVVRLLFNDKMPFDFNSRDVWTMFHSFSFDFSVWEMYGALLYGGRLVIVPRASAQDPGEFLGLLRRQGVTVLNQTPTAFYSLLPEELGTAGAELQTRYVIFGGEALRPLMLKAWREKYPHMKLVNMYGITETTVHVTYKEITEKEIDSNACNIGRPLPTLTAYIMDSRLRLLPVGAVGELCVGGDGVGRGYLNRRELTCERFPDNPYVEGERLYRSGDLAMLQPDGELIYFGRMDHQVKIRGHRVELGEIETALLECAPVREAVVLAREDEGGNKNLCAYYVSDSELTVPELKGHLSDRLPDYMVPAYFIPVPRIPVTANNKLDRAALPLPEAAVATGEPYEGPQNETEERLLKIWREFLNVDKMGVNDNFFSLGGDSIRAISLVNRINREMGVTAAVRDIYLNQTVRELAGCILKADLPGIEDELEEGRARLDDIRRKVLEDREQAALLPEEYEDFYPLSPIQQGMLFFARLMPDEPIYHDQFPYVVKFKNFDIGIFNRALGLLVQGNSILSTTFIAGQQAQPLQVVHGAADGLVPEIIPDNLAQLSPAMQEEAICSYMREDLKNKFILDGDLLWRLKAFVLGGDNYCFVLSFQHAALDGWSVATMMSSLFGIYDSLIRGEDIKLPSLKSSYKDYVALNMGRKASDRVRGFWKENLGGYSRNKLPFNLSGKKIRDMKGSRILQRDLGADLRKALEARAKAYGCTLKDICFAAHVYLLGILTGESDIVTGMVTHDRPALEDGEKVLGCYLNTVPVRIETDTNIKKTDFINKVKKTIRDIKPNELFLGDIAGIIGEQNGSGNPIFDTLHNYTDFHALKSVLASKTVAEADTEIKLTSNEMTNTLFDLEVSATLDVFAMQIKYSPAYFRDEEINTAAELYTRVLREFVSDDGEDLTSEKLLSDEQFNQLVYHFNDTGREYAKEKTLHLLFEEQALRTPGNLALVQGDTSMTYAELNAYANRLARRLLESGVKSRDHVGLIAQRGFDMIAGMLAILKCGGAYVPIDPDYPAARKEYIAGNAKVSAILSDRQYDIEHDNTVIIDRDELSRYPSDNVNAEKDSRYLAYVIYTSGSTGNPKGVMIEHRSAVNLISWVNREYRVSGDDALLFITSMCFDLSVYDIFGILAAGGRVVIAGREQVQNPEELMALLSEHRITFWDSVPSTMNYLVGYLEDNGRSYVQESLRLVFMSGDWIPVSLPDRLLKYFPNAVRVSLGGATEGTVWSIYYPIEKVDEGWSSIPYGKPLDNNSFYILDKNHNVVPRGVAGELYIGGVGVARGYMGDIERTSASFLRNRFSGSPDDRMYKTGDLGRMLPDGNIEFLGRADHQVKIRGYRVELGEVESRLLKHPCVKAAVVVDRTDSTGNKYLCAYVVWEKETPSSEMRDFLLAELPSYMLPSYFIGIEAVPLTANGKIDRKALPEPGLSVNSGSSYAAPVSKTEAELVQIWQEVLEVERVGIHDSFFELGGHSLTATVLASRVHKAFGAELTLREVFGNQTVSQMAAIVDEKLKETDDMLDILLQIENMTDEEVQRLLQ